MSAELARIKLVRRAVEKAEAEEKYSSEYCEVDQDALAAIRERKAKKRAEEETAETIDSAGQYCVVYKRDETGTPAPYAVDNYNNL